MAIRSAFVANQKSALRATELKFLPLTAFTSLLLDAAQSCQREVQRTTADVPEEVRQLLARLRHPNFARILVVTLAKSRPVDETDRLQADLQRAGIQPSGCVANASLANSQSTHPTRRAKRPRRCTH